MGRGLVINVRSNKDTHFTTAIAQNAEEREDLTLPAAIGAGLDSHSRLRTIRITSLDSRSWEIWLWKKKTYSDPDLNQDSFCGVWSFSAGDGKQVAGAGFYYYYIDGLDVCYNDESSLGQLHCALLNRSAAAKTVGPNVVVEFGFEPTD